MTKFKVGDLVKVNGYEGTFVITTVDCFSSPIVKYGLDRMCGDKSWMYETSLKKHISFSEILDLGTTIVEENFYGVESDAIHTENLINWIKIRVMSYEDNIYYIKMINNGVVEFKEIKQ